MAHNKLNPIQREKREKRDKEIAELAGKKTLEAIGKDYGMTRERVRQIIVKQKAEQESGKINIKK